jgi:hypothetical protein
MEGGGEQRAALPDGGRGNRAPIAVFDFFDFQSTEIKAKEPKRRSELVEACTHVPAIRGRDAKPLRTMGRSAAQRTFPRSTPFARRSSRAGLATSGRIVVLAAAYDFFDFL